MDSDRRGGRVIDCSGLENRRTERYRGFESLPLRNLKRKLLDDSNLRFFCKKVFACRRFVCFAIEGCLKQAESVDYQRFPRECIF